MRKSKKTDRVTVSDVRNKDYVGKLIENDEGYKILKDIWSSPSYWESKKKDLLAMLRQLGPPILFLSISTAEKMWPELLCCLYTLSENKSISIPEALSLSDAEKTRLIRNNPLTCARYFDYKMNKFTQLLKKPNSIFKGFRVMDTNERVEFQMRGSPNEHIFLWIDESPVCNLEDSRSLQKCVAFIDEFITCRYDPEDPYIVLQRHKHTHTCRKRNRTGCRFNFPQYVMPETVVLVSLSEEEVTEKTSEDLKTINEFMQRLYKSNEVINFAELLQKLDVSKDEYIHAIRSSIKRPQPFLRRRSMEVGINNYNKNILHLMESNMDVQFVLEEYGLATYVINYSILEKWMLGCARC